MSTTEETIFYQLGPDYDYDYDYARRLTFQYKRFKVVKKKGFEKPF